MSDLPVALTSTPKHRPTVKSMAPVIGNGNDRKTPLHTIQVQQLNRNNKFIETKHSECKDTGSAIDSHGVQCTRSVQTDSSLLDDLLEERQLRQIDASTDSGHQSGYLDQEASDLMVNDNIPEHYWRDVADERRRALLESLEENKKLHEENEQLRKENSRLSVLAQKAEELQDLLNTALADDADEDEKTYESSPENTESISELNQSSLDDNDEKPSESSNDT